MRKGSFAPARIVGALVVSVVCTVLVSDGWMIWVPVVPALLVVSRLGGDHSGRRVH